LQESPHDVPLHVAVPFASPGQGEQLAPQVAGAMFDAQAPAQRWNAGLHTQACDAMSHVSLVVHCASSTQPVLH
jgi:hypothetical protein